MMSKDLLVEAGDKVWVWYVGSLEDGTVFDTNVEEKAKEHKMHNPQRPYEPLNFEVNAGQMIAGFDKGVLGMTINEKKTIKIDSKDAYWEWTEERVIKVEKNKLPKDQKIEEGMQVVVGQWQVVKIHKIEEEHVHFDMNHELAGKSLIFDVEIVSCEKGDGCCSDNWEECCGGGNCCG